VENGLLTPTMKLKRAKVMEKFNAEIDAMYAGH
jgi:long-chain acyl-CoA synthetase